MTSDRTADRTRVPPDSQIARNASTRPIEEVASVIGPTEEDLEPRGTGIAKLRWDAIERELDTPTTGNLILVTVMTPTRRGAGKTVPTVGLGQALGQLGESNAVANRRNSLALSDA